MVMFYGLGDTKRVAKGIVVYNNHILLLKNKKGLFELPGGHIQGIELPEQAMRRELREETGVENIYSIKQIHSNSKRVLYLIKIKTGEVKLSNEHVGFRFANRKHLTNYRLSRWTFIDLKKSGFLLSSKQPTLQISDSYME